MAANFREVAAYSGVDEKLPSGGQGIVIPSGGSTLVILEDAKGLDVRSTIPSKVHVYEFTTKQELAGAAKNASNPADALRRFEEDSWRIFRIKADAPVGIDKARVEAKNTKTGRAEATLKVIVLNKKTVKVAIRPAQVSDGKQLVRLGSAADPQKLLDEMNAIWNPQANVYSNLGARTRQRSTASGRVHRDAEVAEGFSGRA
jgi:hypothetical protein